MKKETKERVVIEVYAHEYLLTEKVREEMSATCIYKERPNKHYKKFLLIEV